MITLIGLGNPGKEYEGTRHNVGRDALAAFLKKENTKAGYEDKFKSLVAEAKIGKEKFLVALPDTFMNNSGLAAKKLKAFFKLKPERIFVAHDDADIPLGRTKLSFARDSAGHKGVESVMRGLGTKKFWRLRIGVGPMAKGKKPGKHVAAEKLVLKTFSKDETPHIRKAIKKTVEAVSLLGSKRPEEVMNQYNAS